jgi:hypothetical protein
MDVCLLWVLCVVRYRSLRRIDHSSRGVLPTVAHRCVWSRNLENEEAKSRYRAVENTTRWVVTPRKQTTWFVEYSVTAICTKLCCAFLSFVKSAHRRARISYGLIWNYVNTVESYYILKAKDAFVKTTYIATWYGSYFVFNTFQYTGNFCKLQCRPTAPTYSK